MNMRPQPLITIRHTKETGHPINDHIRVRYKENNTEHHSSPVTTSQNPETPPRTEEP